MFSSDSSAEVKGWDCFCFCFLCLGSGCGVEVEEAEGEESESSRASLLRLCDLGGAPRDLIVKISFCGGAVGAQVEVGAGVGSGGLVSSETLAMEMLAVPEGKGRESWTASKDAS